MTTPPLRFKADDGSAFPSWKACCLSDICTYSTSRSKGQNFVSTENMLKDFAGIQAATESSGAGTVYQPGDTLLSNIRPYLRKAWLANCTRVCSSDVLVLHPGSNVTPYFLHLLIANDKFIDYVMKSAKGTKMPRGDKASIMNWALHLPCPNEQLKIAGLLSAVDEVIAQQQAEVAAWEQRKQGVAQKLFAQEVRFKADDGSTFPKWELVRIGDVGCFIGGLSFKSSAVVESDGIAVLTATNVGSDGTLDYNHNVLLVAKEAKAHQYLQPNDVVVCKSNGSQHLVGKAAKYDGGYHGPKGITVGAFCGIFRSTSPIIPYWFQSEDYHDLLKNSRQGGDGSLLNIKGSDIENHYVILPSSQEEQRKIAECLGAIDEVIALAKAELEKWRELKKGLLQQLFV